MTAYIKLYIFDQFKSVFIKKWLFNLAYQAIIIVYVKGAQSWNSFFHAKMSASTVLKSMLSCKQKAHVNTSSVSNNEFWGSQHFKS